MEDPTAAIDGNLNICLKVESLRYAEHKGGIAKEKRVDVDKLSLVAIKKILP